MNDSTDCRYDDEKLNSMDIAGLIFREWQSGQHESIAAVTSAVHSQQPELPRSVVFWLAYHALHELTGHFPPPGPVARAWPLR